MTQQQDESNPPSATDPDQDQGEQLVLNSPEDASSLKDYALWAGVIVLTVLTIYAPALRGDFLWDDDRHVSLNRNLRDFPGLVNIWTKLGFRNGGTIQYYPLTHTTFWLEYQLSGAQPGQINTLVFHTTNVVLHAISAILLWLVLRELKVPGSWVAAAIWALHPIQVESVAWMSERKNVLAGVFFFGSALAFLKSRFGVAPVDETDPSDAARSRAVGYFWLALGLFVCALLSKSVSASLPAVLLLLLWWKQRLTVKHVLATVPFFVLGLAMAGVTGYVESTQVGARGAEWDIPFAHRLLIAGRAIWFYVEKNLLPVKLTFIYPRWNLPAASAAWWFFPAAVVGVIAVLFALQKKIGRGPVVAFLIFCGVLLPALGFFNFYPMRYSFVADHFQYLAGPALIALIVATVAAVLRRMSATAPAAPYVIAGIVLVVLSALTVMQARVYASQQTLWADAVAKNPGSWMLQYNYGVSLLHASDQLEPQEAARSLDQAIDHFKRATEILPTHERAWNGWGQALLLRGKHDDALKKFDESIAVNQKLGTVNIDPMMGRGRALFDAGRLEESRQAFEQALASANELRGTGAVERIEAATIYQFLGRIASERNELDSAARFFNEAVKIAGDSSMIRYEYGHLLAKMARNEMGLSSTTQPVVIAATAPATGPSVASTKPATQPSDKAKQLLAGAAAQFASAIEIRPDFIDARIALANLMMDVGNLAGARAQLAASAQVFRSLGTNAMYPPLEEAVKRWDTEFRQREAAATQPRASTRPATDITTEVFSAPTTRPSTP